MIDYICLGHRCHIAAVAFSHFPKKASYPFDDIISKWNGIINCFEEDFQNFFPKKIVCKKIWTGNKDPLSDENGNRRLFQGKFFAFTYHNLNERTVVDTFKRRITRLNDFLKNTDHKVLFLRAILDDNEIEGYPRFRAILQQRYSNLNFKLLFISTNSELPEGIWRKEDFVVANDVGSTQDENDPTDDCRYNFLFDYLKSADIV